MDFLQEGLIKYFGKDYSNYISSPQQVKEIVLEDVIFEEIENVDGLEIFTELTYLNISGMGVRSIEALKDLKKLQIFYADFCKISDFKPLSELHDLREIDISAPLFCIDNLEPFRNLHNLEKLYVPDHRIKSIKPIFNLKNLKLLSISRNEVPREEIEEFKLLHKECEVWYQ